jgi:hypothetical protein
MWTAFKTMIEQLFNALTVLCAATEKLAKSVDNGASAIEVSSRSLIPSQEEITADLELSMVTRQIAKVEALNKLKTKVGNDPTALKVIDDQIAAIKAANKPK